MDEVKLNTMQKMHKAAYSYYPKLSEYKNLIFYDQFDILIFENGKVLDKYFLNNICTYRNRIYKDTHKIETINNMKKNLIYIDSNSVFKTFKDSSSSNMVFRYYSNQQFQLFKINYHLILDDGNKKQFMVECTIDAFSNLDIFIIE